MIVKASERRFMRAALAQARLAARRGDIPVGAVIIRDGRIIARGRNEIVGRRDPCAHAEVLAIQRAAKRLKNERLNGCTLYTTLEPCPMCSGAIVLARLDAVVFGAPRPEGKLDNHRYAVAGPLMPRACGGILKEFFRKKR